MTAQARTRSIADAQLLDELSVMNSASLKIAQRLRVAVELLLIESDRVLKHSGRVDGIDWKSTLLFEIGQALAEGHMAGQLDKANEIPTLTAAMTVENIFAGVDIERRPSFRVQRAESDELGMVTRGLRHPVLLL